MIRDVKIISAFITIFLCVNIFNPVKAELKLNDFFLYEIIDAGYYLEIGENRVVFNGFMFGAGNYPPGTKVNATVYNIDDLNIGFKFYIGNRSRLGFFSANWFDGQALDFSFKALYHTYDMMDYFGNGFWIDLTLFQILPFINPKYNSYLSNPQSLGEAICDIFLVGYHHFPTIECKYNYTIMDDLLYFESWVGGKVKGYFGRHLTGTINYYSDISFGNNFRFTVDRVSGIVQGFARRGWVEGTINNTNVKICMTCEYELEGYDFPGYLFGSYRNFLETTTNEPHPKLYTLIPVAIFVIAAMTLTIYFFKFPRKSEFD